MKPKIELEKLKEMIYPEYLKALKKEVKRAAAEGRTEFVVLSDFIFKEDSEPRSVLILREFGGKVQKFYTQQKKERSVEKDFGRGSAYFEENTDGTVTLHLGLEAGKAKAARIKKNGKKTFKKLGLDVNVYKGESDLDDTNDVISEEEENANSQTADLLVKDERIQKIHKQYIHFFQLVTQNTLPKLKDNAAVDSTDFENSKQLYILTDAYQKEFETLSENEKPEYRTTLQKVQNNADQIKKIYAKVKQLAMAQNPKEDDQTIVTDEPLHSLFEAVENLDSLIVSIEASLAAEAEEPIEATDLKQKIQSLETEINNLEKQTQAYITNEPKSFAELQKRLQPWKEKLTTAKVNDEAFDAKRAEETKLLQQIQGKWGELAEMEKHIQGFLAEKKSTQTLFNYEKSVLSELCESYGIQMLEIEAQTKRVKHALLSDFQNISAEKQKLEAILKSYKVVPHPSGKDKYYDAYVNIDQTKPASEWLESVHNLNEWLTEQEGVKEQFKEKVSLEVAYLNQAYLYSLDDLTENDIKRVGKNLTLKTATTDEKKEALAKKNGVACKDTCDRMIINYAKDKNLDIAKFNIKNFNLLDSSGYISIAKEDKSKIEKIVTKEGMKVESLENDALNYEKSAEEAYQYIFDLLNTGKPLVVGVDLTFNTKYGTTKSATTNAGYNNDKTTDHFIVIIGKGIENGVPFLEYLDPGTMKGIKSDSNRLYPLWKGNELFWYDPKASWLADGTYCLTAVCLYE